MQYLKTTIKFIFKLINYIYNINTLEYIKLKRAIIYSLWLKPNFKSCKSVFIFPKVVIKGSKYICIGEKVSIQSGCRIEAFDYYQNQKFSPLVIIGNNVSFNYNCHLGAINKIVIKDNVLFGSNILITDHSHGDFSFESLSLPPVNRPLISKGAVIIEENVWICENVSILPNVSIGKNSIIAANSVVTKSIPANVLAAGNPAVPKRFLK